MASEFRPSTPADAASIARLCERVLAVPQHSPTFSPELMHWKYWQPWPGSGGPRSFVLTRGERLLAHGAVLPLELELGGRVHRLLHLFDWASEPDAIGSGAALLKRIRALSDGMLIVGGSTLTQRMVAPLGFRPLGSVERLARAPRPPADAVEARATDVLRRVSAAELPLPSSESSGTSLRFARSRERLEHFLRCPAAPMTCHVVEHAGQASGGFVLAEAPGQTRLVAAWCHAPGAEAWSRLVRAACSVASAARPDVEMVAMASDRAELEALRGAGFVDAGSAPMFVLSDPRLIANDARVAFQMLDGDVAFLHHGTPERWLEPDAR